MGIGHGAICNSCGKHFTANDGCSMVSELLHCELCGKEKWIPFSEFGRYPDFLESSPYEKDIEKFAGRCSCGGQFRVRAPAWCPRCKSSDWKEDPVGPIINYD